MLVIRAAVQALVTLSLGLLAALPAAEAQRPARLPHVGIVWVGGPRTIAHFHEAFLQGLRDHGYVQGQTIAVEARYADGRAERLPSLMTELAALKPDVIVAPAASITRAAKQVTSTIPIVMANVFDPVALGFVASLPKPGGNITGIANLSEDLTAKRLQLLKEAVPKASRVAVLWDRASPAREAYGKILPAAARALGLSLHTLEVGGPDEFEKAFAEASQQRAGALLALAGGGEPLFFTHRKRLMELIAQHRLPAMFGSAVYAEAGGLMSYGPNLPAMFRYAATFVDKILKGAKPADLPVEQPTRFELVINMKTAKALGLTFPQSILIRADRVIQ